MININLFIKDSGEPVGFEISGHAEYAEHGSDIVCAAVSSAAYMAINTVASVIKADAEFYVEEIGHMFLNISEKDISKCFDILTGFRLHVLSLEEQYPQNIIVNYTEV